MRQGQRPGEDERDCPTVPAIRAGNRRDRRRAGDVERRSRAWRGDRRSRRNVAAQRYYLANECVGLPQAIIGKCSLLSTCRAVAGLAGGEGFDGCRDGYDVLLLRLAYASRERI